MRLDNLNRYSSEIARKIQEAQDRAASLEHARNTSEGKMQSRYDTQKEIFAAELSIQQGVIDQLLGFRAFLQRIGLGDPRRDRIVPGAEFDLELWDAGEKIENGLYAPVNINLRGVQIITPNSLVGQAIEGMRAGNTFVYTQSMKPLAQRRGRDYMAGVIKRVE